MIKVIFCAYNEEKSIKDFIDHLDDQMKNIKEDHELITCLDGSSDKTEVILKKLQKSHQLTILPYKKQRGLGTAYKRLFQYVINNSNPQDLIISLDADITHNPNQIPQMIEHFKQNKLDLLVASRFCKGSTMSKFPFYRKLISKAVSITLQTIFRVKNINGQKLQDFTSGYRIYQTKILQKLHQEKGQKFIEEKEFTYTCELLIKLAKIGAKSDEFPLKYDYDKKIGESKLRIWRNMCRLVILIFKLVFFR